MKTGYALGKEDKQLGWLAQGPSNKYATRNEEEGKDVFVYTDSEMNMFKLHAIKPKQRH